MSTEADERVRQRQLGCHHTFIKGMADKVARCVYCGVSEKELQALRENVPPPAWLGGGGIP